VARRGNCQWPTVHDEGLGETVRLKQPENGQKGRLQRAAALCREISFLVNRPAIAGWQLPRPASGITAYWQQANARNCVFTYSWQLPSQAIASRQRAHTAAWVTP
jgi:hypothetical protein